MKYNGHSIGNEICNYQSETQAHLNLFEYPYYNKYLCFWDKDLSLANPLDKCLKMNATPKDKDACFKNLEETKHI
jgi:hypothetical protein